MIRVLTLLLIGGSFLFAQQKYLVSPNNEVIPLKKNDRALDIISKRSQQSVRSSAGTCGPSFTFGYPFDLYPPSYQFYCYQKDVFGEWSVAKAKGTVDTVFWWGGDHNYAKDSIVFLRIHRSIIGPDYGPGIGIHANAPPCQSWGYWINSLDLERGVAAFPDDATDTTWHSTINTKGGTVATTRPPFGYAKWGALGYGKTQRQGLNYVAMMDAGDVCSLQVGEKFFISLRINSGLMSEHYAEAYEYGTSLYSWGSVGPLTTSDEMWPSPVWKFYEHDSGPSNCAGTPVTEAKRGWLARGPWVNDPAYTSALNFWYAMTVVTNVPPTIKPVDNGDIEAITMNTAGPYVIQYEMYDCDPVNPENAGIAIAEIYWSTAELKSTGNEFVEQSPMPMVPIGGDLWEGEIPGQPNGTLISYQIIAKDNDGLTTKTGSRSFRVYSLKQQYYKVDTGACGTMYTIKGLGSTNEIQYSDFFLPPTSDATNPADDGTAGPFDIGENFPIFADYARYAWIGINGAFALSKSATDTIDVNSDGYYYGWIIPSAQHHGRSDTSTLGSTPPNFISPFWADFILADTGTNPEKFGHIFYGNADDPCKFIVEWDSIGSFNSDIGEGETDATIFRTVLNKCDGTIEYQYVVVGTRGQDSSALVGMQADSSEISGPEPGWVFVNYYILPFETKPKPEFCIKFYPGAAVFAQAGWNLLSVANDRPGDMAKISVYPDAVSDAFKYIGSYQQEPTLVNGVGYWLKYDKYTYAGVPGYPKNSVTANVSPGWNMIGSITKGVPTSGIVKTPGSMIVSDYFKYDGGYQTVTTLTPGLGYWVKTDVGGTLDLAASAEMPKVVAEDYSKLNKLTIIDRYGRMQKLYIGNEDIVKAQSIYTGEMPPAAPDFDARFASTGGMVVSHPANVEGRLEYAISVTTDAYPITVMWEALEPMTLYAGGKMASAMEGRGAVQLKSTAGLVVSIGAGVNIPKVFALGQNYPNPFNPVTRFSYDVPKLADVQIAVYNVLGQKVKTLLSGDTSPGSYEMEWDGTDGQGVSVPTGIYFIRMSADEFKATQKVMLMK